MDRFISSGTGGFGFRKGSHKAPKGASTRLGSEAQGQAGLAAEMGPQQHQKELQNDSVRKIRIKRVWPQEEPQSFKKSFEKMFRRARILGRY